MIDKILITNKLNYFFQSVKIDSFFKVFLISFFFDKVNYLEKIVGNSDALNMLDKYIYNLEQNLKIFKKLDTYHSLYTKYDYEKKQLNYYISNNSKNFFNINLNDFEKRQLLIQELKIMMYKEFEKIINIYSSNGKIISNGFYIEDLDGRYPDYNGKFSEIIDIFSEIEACNISHVDNKIKTYIDKEKIFFVYSQHFSKRNSEVMNYVTLWKLLFDKKLLYFAMNNPRKYTKKMINDFNQNFKYVLDKEYKFLLKNTNIFFMIENYLLHIRNRINEENNIQYHQDLSVLFKLLNKKNTIPNYTNYLLHTTNDKNKLEYNNI